LTNNNRPADVTGAITARALLGTINCQIGRKTFDRFFKRERKRHFDICAALRLRPRWFLVFAGGAAKKIRKNIAEAAAAAATRRGCTAPIKAREIKARRSRSPGTWSGAACVCVRQIL